jgi:hypothetical protein
VTDAPDVSDKVGASPKPRCGRVNTHVRFGTGVKQSVHRAGTRPATDPADDLLVSLASLAVGQTDDPLAVGQADDRAEAAADARKPTATSSDADRATPPDLTDLPPSWVVSWSEKRQRWYYFDKKTARTQWHRPEVVLE